MFRRLWVWWKNLICPPNKYVGTHEWVQAIQRGMDEVASVHPVSRGTYPHWQNEVAPWRGIPVYDEVSAEKETNIAVAKRIGRNL